MHLKEGISSVMYQVLLISRALRFAMWFFTEAVNRVRRFFAFITNSPAASRASSAASNTHPNNPELPFSSAESSRADTPTTINSGTASPLPDNELTPTPVKNIPGPLSVPVFGASWLYSNIGRYTHDKYHEASFDKLIRYGPVVREEVLWNIPLIHLFDKDDILKVLHFKSDYPLRPHNEADVFYRKSRSDIYANVGMVNENGRPWYELRKHLSPPLTNRKTPHHYARHMNTIADDLISVLARCSSNGNDGNDASSRSEVGTLDGMANYIYQTGLEMMCNVALERRMGFLDSDNISKEVEAIMVALRGYQAASTEAMYGLPWWKYVPSNLSGVFTQLVKHKDDLFNTIGSLVDETMASTTACPNAAATLTGTGSADRDDHEADSTLSSLSSDVGDERADVAEADAYSILGQLLSNKALPLQEVKVSCVDYITAGVDTVGNSLMFAVWLIARHKPVQRRLQGELDEFYARCGNEAILNPESIQSLVYLRSCVKEAFRLYPTASQIARLTEKPIRVNGGHILPPYSVVLCHTMVACRQESNFTQAEEYIPSRWISSERDSSWNHEPSLVAPFGVGKRICPGKRLAEQEVHILTAKIFHNFNLTPVEDELKTTFNFLLAPASQLKFKIEPRSEQ